MQRVVFFFNALFFTVSGFGIILELGIRSLLDKRRRQSNVALAHSTAAELRGIMIKMNQVCHTEVHLDEIVQSCVPNQNFEISYLPR